jgi:hypothetical protein
MLSRGDDAIGDGKTESSWIKHDILNKVATAQISAYRHTHPQERILLIDGNAGDGEGVDKMQPDLFLGLCASHPTPEILTNIAARIGNADVVLCERNFDKRVRLHKRFPDAIILENHSKVPEALMPRHHYALWVSDPCGYSTHGVPHMRRVADCLRCDFIVVFNEGALERLMATNEARWETARDRWTPMIDPQWWMERLNKPLLSRTRVIYQSRGFHYRVLVLSTFLAEGARRPPFNEVINRKGGARDW